MTSSIYRNRVAIPAAFALLVALLPFVSGSHAQSRPALNGIVTDSLGARIPDAIITSYSADRVLRTSTDAEGRFVLTNAPPGTYQVEVSRPGFKTKTIQVEQTSGHDAHPLSISLAVASTGDCGSFDGSISYGEPSTAGGGKLAVKVLDSKTPLAQVTVSLTKTFAPQRQFERTTNAIGEIHVDDLEAGQYTLKVSHGGYSDARTGSFWITRENQTTVVMQMQKQGLIRICE